MRCNLWSGHKKRAHGTFGSKWLLLENGKYSLSVEQLPFDEQRGCFQRKIREYKKGEVNLT
jgi:hypothetical protein